MVEIPTGSLVGLCVVIGVLGIIAGRSSRFMRRAAHMHAAVHNRGGNQRNDQRVQTVVMIDGATGQAQRFPVMDVTEDRSVSELLGGDADEVAELLAADDQHLWSVQHERSRDELRAHQAVYGTFDPGREVLGREGR